MENKKGFTLVEMLASMAVLAILAGILFSSYNALSRTRRNSLHQMDSYSDSRFAIPTITKSIHEMSCLDPVSNADLCVINVNITCPWEMHFISIHDNNSGSEQVEMHYYYDGTNTLYFCQQTRDFPAVNFDIHTNPTGWWQTPSIGDLTKYSDIINNVAFVTTEMYDDNDLRICAVGSSYMGHLNVIPRLVHMRIGTIDSDVVRRYSGSAAKAFQSESTNLMRVYDFWAKVQMTP